MVIRFQTAADLHRLLAEHWPGHDILFMAAAVADYTPAVTNESGKLKRDEGPISLQLIPTPDLLAGLAGASRPNQTVIGFALEPAERLIASAQTKLVSKDLDAIVANPLETMDSVNISGAVIFRDGTTITAPPDMPKIKFAQWLIENVLPKCAKSPLGRR